MKKYALRCWNTRAPLPEEPNEALTLEELREMDGQPVWLRYDLGSRCKVIDFIDERFIHFTDESFVQLKEVLSDLRLVYRRTPETAI